MTNRIARLAGSVLLLGVAAIAVAKVRTDYDRSVDFSRYRTYSWIDLGAETSLWADRIQAGVDRELAMKGWIRVPSGGDAQVAAFRRTTQRDIVRTFYTGGGYYWGGGSAITTVEPQQIGNLTVDILDSETRKLLWRGTAEKTLSSKPAKNIDRLEDQLHEMFKRFPPVGRIS